MIHFTDTYISHDIGDDGSVMTGGTRGCRLDNLRAIGAVVVGVMVALFSVV